MRSDRLAHLQNKPNSPRLPNFKWPWCQDHRFRWRRSKYNIYLFIYLFLCLDYESERTTLCVSEIVSVNLSLKFTAAQINQRVNLISLSALGPIYGHGKVIDEIWHYNKHSHCL